MEETRLGKGTSPITDEAPGLDVAPAPGVQPNANWPGAAAIVRRPAYEVRLDAFEGPLDLLLHLIREHEIDIYDIPIASITAQYLEYIAIMESLDLELAGEFLEMAATLIRIKAQMLLPSSDFEEEEQEDPREQLVRKLVAYKEFKEAARGLSEREEDRREHFPHAVDPKAHRAFEEEDLPTEEFLRDVTLFDLVDSLREVLARIPARIDVHAVDVERVTVEEQMERLREIVASRDSVTFLEIFERAVTKMAIVTTFIALLELIRLGAVEAAQKRVFGEIVIRARVEGA